MIAIINGKIFTCYNNDIYHGGTILIDQGKIYDIGYDIKIPDNCEIIDAKGLNVYPGFIDAHSHIGLIEEGIGYEGEDENERTGPIQPELRAIDGVNPMDGHFKESYEAGVTTVVTGPGSANVIGGTFLAMKTFGNRVDKMVVKDPVAMKVAFGENPKKVYGKNRSAQPETRMAIAALLRKTLFEAREYMERKGKDPVKFDLKMEALIPVLKKEIPLKIHAHRADDIFTAIRIKKEFDIDITLDHCTEGHLIVDELKKENIDCIVGPSLSFKSKFELKNKSFTTAAALAKENMKIAIMTDCPVIPQNYLPLCAALCVKSGMDPYDALNAITINAAEITGIDSRVGSLEVGKDADIVIINGNFITDIDWELVYTIIDGNICYNSKEN